MRAVTDHRAVYGVRVGRALACAAIAGAAIGGAAGVFAQTGPCVGWEPVVPMTGTDAPVRGGLVWDPDGPGPRDEVLVAYGDFSTAGGVVSPGIAVWDGDAWRAWDGPLLPFDGRLYTQAPLVMAVKDGALYAVNAQQLFVLRENAWVEASPPFPSRLVTAFSLYAIPPVRALVPQPDGWIVAGHPSLRLADGSSSSILRLRDGVWTGFGGGVGAGHDGVSSVVVTDEGVFAAGSFRTVNGVATQFAQGLARWNGQVWIPPMGAGSDSVTSGVPLALSRGRPLVTIGQQLSYWDGDQLLPARLQTFDVADVGNLLPFEDGVLAAGVYRRAGQPGRGATAVLRINSDGSTSPSGAPVSSAYSLVGGFSVQGRTVFLDSPGLVITPGTAPQADTPVGEVLPWRGGLVARAGRDRLLYSASGDAGTWRAFGASESVGVTTHEQVVDVTVWNNEVVFAISGVDPVMAFDGRSVRALRPAGFDGRLSGNVVQVFEHTGDLYAAGSMTIGSITGVQLARYRDGVWSPVGARPGAPAGVRFTFTTSTSVGSVAFHSWNGLLLASGRFDTVDGQPGGLLVAFDGTTWRRMDLGLTTDLSVIASGPGSGGSSVLVGVGGSVRNQLWQWNGERWQTRAPGANLDYWARIAVHDGLVHVVSPGLGGVARLENPGTAGERLVRITPTSLGQSVPFAGGFALASVNGRLYTSVFTGTRARGSLPTARLLRLTGTPTAPLFLPGFDGTDPAAPRSVSAFEGGVVQFNLRLANTTDLTRYETRKDGVPLQLGPQPTGSTLTTPFVLSGVRRADSGTYVVTADACGLAADSAPVTVQVFCRGDANRDSVISVADVFYWVNVWFNGGSQIGDPVGPHSRFTDFLRFLNDWFAGCDG